jgi:hypothetical protein
MKTTIKTMMAMAAFALGVGCLDGCTTALANDQIGRFQLINGPEINYQGPSWKGPGVITAGPLYKIDTITGQVWVVSRTDGRWMPMEDR